MRKATSSNLFANSFIYNENVCVIVSRNMARQYEPDRGYIFFIENKNKQKNKYIND